jgi:pullulanase/glycogen debranching enzyme
MKVYSINANSNNNSIGNQQLNFKRNWSEHISWGANYLKKNGTTDFKLFSFPDAKSVFVEVAHKITAQLGGIKDRIVKVAGVAGTVLTIENITSSDNDSKVYRMEHKGNGVYEAKNIKAKPDDKYRYIVVDKNNGVNLVKDPYAKKQEDINGWSSIYNPDNYEWKNTDWIRGKDSRRIIRKPSEPLRGLDKLIIEEINIPTVSSEGTFSAAKSYIDTIAEKGFANAIEIMPVENTFSMQWGYDGVDKFAVNEKLGGAKDLKELIDYAHGKGLNVIMDMVPNHMGPDGDYLTQTGPYEKGSGPFGGELNYEGNDNRYVRDWMTNAALWWANEFKVDGLRLDMTKHCGSDYLLKQIVSELNEHNPNVFIIAEDGRENKDSVTRYEETRTDHNDALDFIDTQVKFIAEKGWHSTPGNIGFDSEWDFRLMHTIKNAILDSGANLLEDLDNKILSTQYRIKYVMSHDEIGNEDGTRLIPKVMCRHLNLFLKTDGHNDADKGQKAAHAAQKLSELVVSKDFEIITNDALSQYEKSLGLNTFIPKEELITAFQTATAKNKLALGTVMTIPGPTMFFQGDDKADLSYFKFFREFSGEKYAREHFDNYKSYIISQKGYDTYLTEGLSQLECLKI